MNLILKKILGYKYLSIEREVVPVFTNIINSTNKIWELKKIKKTNLGNNIETQNHQPIYIKNNFESNGKRCIHNKEFVKNGFKFGQTLHFKKQGFLMNINSIHKVVLVTDKYVYTQIKKGGWVYSYNYKELEKMKNVGML